MYTIHFHSASLNVTFIMFFLNTVNYPVFFPLMSTLTWGTFLSLRGTWGLYLNHVIPHRASKSYRVGGWVAHKILVSAPVPLELILLGLTGLGLGLGALGLGTGLDNCSISKYTLIQASTSSHFCAKDKEKEELARRRQSASSGKNVTRLFGETSTFLVL